jgi:heme A synthase
MIHAQRLAIVTSLLTIVLIGVGTLVRATGSGLGCPDWPLCYGQVIPPDKQAAWIEVSHRFLAAIVGLLLIAVAVMAWKYYRHVPFITWLATATVPLVGFQGLLGAISVLRELPPEVVATHLVTAMIVLSAVIIVAVAMWMEDERHRDFAERIRAASRSTGSWALAGLGLLFVSFWIGAYMAQIGGATACQGWPLCNGRILPAANEQEITHMVHRYLSAGFLFFLVPAMVTAWRLRDRMGWAGPYVIALGVLFIVQVFVGALNVWFTFPDPLTISHTVLAACIWAVLTTGAALMYYRPYQVVYREALPPAGAPA